MMTTTCAICLEETELTMLPCCGSKESTTRFCVACLRLHVQTMGLGGVGRCPKCRTWIAVEGDRVVQRDAVDRCRMCRQMKVIVEDRMCDACVFGCRLPLRYECDRCHLAQRIPHPMYRYQEEPGAFTGATWACHQRCGDYTHWRIISDDVGRVPDADAPPSWHRGEAIVARVRSLRQHPQQQRGRRGSACTIS